MLGYKVLTYTYNTTYTLSSIYILGIFLLTTIIINKNLA